jgi:hypothetical protein
MPVMIARVVIAFAIRTMDLGSLTDSLAAPPNGPGVQLPPGPAGSPAPGRREDDQGTVSFDRF